MVLLTDFYTFDFFKKNPSGEKTLKNKTLTVQHFKLLILLN